MGGQRDDPDGEGARAAGRAALRHGAVPAGPEDNYGEPDGELLEDNQRVVGAITRGMLDTMGRSANGQTGIRKDMLDATNRRKFEKGLDYEFNPNVDPRRACSCTPTRRSPSPPSSCCSCSRWRPRA
jgi:hypothetical protein